MLLHAVVDLPGDACDAPDPDAAALLGEHGAGYIDVARLMSGHIHAICESHPLYLFNAPNEPRRGLELARAPISSTLAVAINGQRLERVGVPRFEYDVVNNGVYLLGIDDREHYEVSISYHVWGHLE